MFVKATQVGYHGHIRKREGDIFKLETISVEKGPKRGLVMTPESQFSKIWMKKASERDMAKYYAKLEEESGEEESDESPEYQGSASTKELETQEEDTPAKSAPKQLSKAQKAAATKAANAARRTHVSDSAEA